MTYEPLKAFDKRKQAIMQYVIEERVRQVISLERDGKDMGVNTDEEFGGSGGGRKMSKGD